MSDARDDRARIRVLIQRHKAALRSGRESPALREARKLELRRCRRMLRARYRCAGCGEFLDAADVNDGAHARGYPTPTLCGPVERVRRGMTLPRDRILVGDALTRLRELPDESVHCVVTSPPYYGLRDYDVAGQIGLEASLDEYVDTVVEVFAEVRRVLRRDGTLWLVMGDSYAGGGHGGNVGSTSTLNGSARGQQESKGARERMGTIKGAPKQLLGQPWRVALALQADGWILRADCIWHKPNAMPESVRDRPTKAHEYIFLLARHARYFYDRWAIAEPTTGNAHDRGIGVTPKSAKVPSGWDTDRGDHRKLVGRYPRPKQNASFQSACADLVEQRNARTVWTIQSTPYHGAHFAVYPEELVRRCVAAGTSDRGVCVECGAPWVRVLRKSANGRQEGVVYGTSGWRPSCECDAGEPAPAVVLDPFMGTGTTALVALKMARRYIGVELNPEYVEMTEQRLRAEVPLFAAQEASV